MSGYVVVQNNIGRAIRVSGCVNLFQVLLTSSTYRPTAAWFTCLQRFTIPAGESRYSVTVWASYSQCSQGGPQHGLKACRPDGRMPPLPPGYLPRQALPAPQTRSNSARIHGACDTGYAHLIV